MMFTANQDHAVIRRPDFEKMYKDSAGRIDKRNKNIKKQTDLIIKLRAELKKSNGTHETCTHNVKSTQIEIISTHKSVINCNSDLSNLV